MGIVRRGEVLQVFMRFIQFFISIRMTSLISQINIENLMAMTICAYLPSIGVYMAAVNFKIML